MALEQGADDYIPKPFRIRELLARMKAILRRTSGKGKIDSNIVTVGNNQVNLHTGKIYCGNDEIILTAMEYKLLLVFFEPPWTDFIQKTDIRMHLGRCGRFCE